MMTTQAVNENPEINGQDYKVIWTQLKCKQIPRETQKQFMMTTQAVNENPEINGQDYKAYPSEQYFFQIGKWKWNLKLASQIRERKLAGK